MSEEFLIVLFIALVNIVVCMGIIIFYKRRKAKNTPHDVTPIPPQPAPPVINNTGMSQHDILCPFCYARFKANKTRFLFEINGKPTYLSADPADMKSRQYCQAAGIDVAVAWENGIPSIMRILNAKTREVWMQSPLKVCANAECNASISRSAGKYAPDNGLLLLGLKSSGKTVYISSVINKLNDVLPKEYNCTFSPYNKEVREHYIEDYYKPLMVDHLLPEATVRKDQLTYEVQNPENRVIGITFSDIKGEISGETDKLFVGECANALQYSNYYIVVMDIKDLDQNGFNRSLNESIFSDVLTNATADPARKPFQHLAIVITKSDELVNYEGNPVFTENSPIYMPVQYGAGFDSDREYINSQLKDYIQLKYPQLKAYAEDAFLPENINYFAVSALGKPPAGGKCENIAPMRVEEPILWLLKRSGVLK